MSEAHAPGPESRAVTGQMRFAKRGLPENVSVEVGASGTLSMDEEAFETRTVEIADGRPLRDRFTLETHGFRFVDHETRMTDFFDVSQLKSIYYREMEDLIRAETGAARVVIFDHTLRSGDEGTREARKIREPVPVAHNDFTEFSGPDRVRHVLPDEADELLKGRFAVIQVWRPINRPVESMPLAMCDARSITADHLIATERRHPDRIGEIYRLAYRPDYKWYWFPHMQPNEALVFTCYDSEREGRARFTAHSAFEDPDTPAHAAARESIEVRTFAFFD